MHTYIHTSKQASMHTYIHTYKQASMHAYIHTHIHTNMTMFGVAAPGQLVHPLSRPASSYMYIYIYIYIYVHTHTQTHVYIYIYTHAYIYIYVIHIMIVIPDISIIVTAERRAARAKRSQGLLPVSVKMAHPSGKIIHIEMCL